MRPILYAEDSEDDAFLMQRAFRQVKLPNPLVIVPDGRLAIEYLSGQGRFADRTQHLLPALVLLDVKMPYQSGFEVLQWIRKQSEFESIPVLMLTSSSQESDIRAAASYGANGYLVKPSNLGSFREMVHDVGEICAGAAVPSGWLRFRGGVAIPPANVP